PAAVVIAQHIAAEFAVDLVEWLQGRCPFPVEAARPGGVPRKGVVSVAVTNDHPVLTRGGTFHYTAEPAGLPFRPTVNGLVGSLARNWPHPGVAVLLTGMGSDGANGLALLRQAGWLTIAQDQATSVVYGMPRAAAEMNAASRILPLQHISGAIAARLN